MNIKHKSHLYIMILSLCVLSLAIACDEEQCISMNLQNIWSDEQLEFLHLINADVEWAKDAKACKIGQYSVYAPNDGSSSHLFMIADNHTLIFVITPDSLTILKSPRKVLLNVLRDEVSGEYKSISYDGYDSKTKSEVSAFDFDLDGQLDARSIYSLDTSNIKREHRIGEDWHEFVEQEGRYGYIIDGEFCPMKEAKAKLIEREEKLRFEK